MPLATALRERLNCMAALQERIDCATAGQRHFGSAAVGQRYRDVTAGLFYSNALAARL